MSEELPAPLAAADVPDGTITSLGRTLSSVIDAGREILARRRLPTPGKVSPAAALLALCRELLEHRGEASGLALASEIVEAYRLLPDSERLALFNGLAADFEVDPLAVQAAAEQYREAPGQENLSAIARAVEAPRQKLFRRILSLIHISEPTRPRRQSRMPSSA